MHTRTRVLHAPEMPRTLASVFCHTNSEVSTPVCVSTQVSVTVPPHEKQNNVGSTGSTSSTGRGSGWRYFAEPGPAQGRTAPQSPRLRTAQGTRRHTSHSRNRVTTLDITNMHTSSTRLSGLNSTQRHCGQLALNSDIILSGSNSPRNGKLGTLVQWAPPGLASTLWGMVAATLTCAMSPTGATPLGPLSPAPAPAATAACHHKPATLGNARWT